MASTMKLPVGIDDFRKLRESHFYYVDKTRLIEQLLLNWSEVTLFTRPRRFGKTLNMSMLKSFFDIGTDKALFDGLYISGNKELCDEYMGKYPVIFLSLKGVDGLTYEEAFEAFVRIMGKEVNRVSFLADSDKLTQIEREQYKGLTIMKNGRLAFDKEKLVSSLQLLSQLLYKHYGKKAVILIDEYDVPLDKAFQNGYYNEMVSLIRGLFGQALKTNEFLQFAVLTGCLRISKESIFTGLNNFKVMSITDSRFDEQFGFTDEEVRKLLSDYGMDSHFDEVKEWYDGYHFGRADVYCPWDVINHADHLRDDSDAKPQTYWINSSGNSLVRRLINRADSSTKDEIERLIAGEAIEKAIRPIDKASHQTVSAAVNPVCLWFCLTVIKQVIHMINHIPRTVNISPAKVISVIPLLYLIKMRIHTIIRQQFFHFIICETELLVKSRICSLHNLEIVKSGKDTLLRNAKAACKYGKL